MKLTAEFIDKCENLAIYYRYQLGLSGYEPLPARKLAAHLQVKIVHPNQLLAGDDLAKALGTDGWSAITVPTQPPIII